jgi:flagellar biosynthesis anti-sigma factor FlgM
MQIKNDGLNRRDGANLAADRANDADRLTNQGAAGPKASQAPPAPDHLELSPAVQVLRTALDEAAAKPEIREALVQRMRALDAAGELGRDTGKLADAIIDSWLSGTGEGGDA